MSRLAVKMAEQSKVALVYPAVVAANVMFRVVTSGRRAMVNALIRFGGQRTSYVANRRGENLQ